MGNKEIRLLRAEEIEVRVGAIYDKGITLLLYKDARVDMNILDEVFGYDGWTREHIMFGDSMFCEVKVRSRETGEWISKMDIGSPSFAEPLKGAASDSFKRACVNIGIGRELYTAPFIWLARDKVNIKQEKGKEMVKDSFSVQSIEYNEEKRSITGLVIVNQKGDAVFNHMSRKREERKQKGLSARQTSLIMKELNRTGIAAASVCRKYNLEKISDMPPALWDKAMESLEKQPDRAA